MTNSSIKIGQLDTIPNFDLQFQSSRFDKLSSVTTPIEMLSNDGNDTPIAQATGFFWSRENKSYLVTNWHVVTGRNPFTNKILSKAGYIPSKIKIYGTRSEKINGNGDFHSFERKPLIIDLTSEDVICKKHRCFDELKIDIIVLEISNDFVSRGKFGGHLNEHGFEKLFHLTGSEIFILGYPLKNYAGMMQPIWKRGSFATEPMFPIDSKPIFIVDAATMEGMSGSPVIRRVFGPVCKADMSVDLSNVVTSEFIGVYSGRLQSSEMQSTNLGYAWYGNLVDQIVCDGVPL